MSHAVKAQRNDMVRQTIARIRTIEKDQGVSREALVLQPHLKKYAR
jgi:hypothetical protein